jgi:hypothetical protein
MTEKPHTVVIGDIHGMTGWKTVIENNPECRYIFTGDYLDPYQPVPHALLLNNLHEIILLKQQHPDTVILLLGNHDLHYFSADSPFSSRFDPKIARRAANLFLEHIRLFIYAFQHEDAVFTHAGISQKWFEDDFRGNAAENIAAQLNRPSQEQVAAICRSGAARGGTHGTVGGIFWADRSELAAPLPGIRQYVGHNRVNDVTTHEYNGGQITFCDCLRYGKYLRME